MARAGPTSSLLLLCLLAACTSRPVVTGSFSPEDQSWSLVGKLGVSAGLERGNFTIDWQQERNAYRINLLGPMGVGVARIEGDDDQVTLNLPGESPVTASNANDLLLATLGLDIPVKPMRYWVRGKPAPGAWRKTPSGIRQQGWNIEYLEFEEDLPVRIRLTRPEVRLVMVVKAWAD